MNEVQGTEGIDCRDSAPGDEGANAREAVSGVWSYATGFGIAALLTAASFYFARSPYVWGPSIPMLLIVLAIAQIGVHLVFFLHITTGPDNTNNVLALAFGVLIVMLVVLGSVWIMSHLSHHAVSPSEMMEHMK